MPKYRVELDTETKTASFYIDDQIISQCDEINVGKYVSEDDSVSREYYFVSYSMIDKNGTCERKHVSFTNKENDIEYDNMSEYGFKKLFEHVRMAHAAKLLTKKLRK